MLTDETTLWWTAPTLPADCPFELIPSFNGNTNKFLGVGVYDRRDMNPRGIGRFCEFFEKTEDAVEWCQKHTDSGLTSTGLGSSSGVPVQESLF